MYGVYAIDPGGTTGICWATWFNLDSARTQQPSSIERYNFPSGDHHQDLYDDILLKRARVQQDARYEPGVSAFVVVCEDFFYRRLDNAVLQPKEYIGVCKLVAQQYGFPLKMQPPAMKSWWTDEKLKAVGLYIKGERHQVDATRHFAFYMMHELGNMTYVTLLRPPSQPHTQPNAQQS